MPDDIWSNPFEAIDMQRSGIMPPKRAATFDLTFPQAELITSQVADWIASNFDSDDHPLIDAFNYQFDEIAVGHTVTPEQAIEAITRTYVENNDELFWEETKSPDAFAHLDNCSWRALAFYFEPDFKQLSELQSA